MEFYQKKCFAFANATYLLGWIEQVFRKLDKLFVQYYFSATASFFTYLHVISNGDSLDWKDLSADEITARVTEKTTSGSIVLFHNAAKNTPAALPAIIENLLENGYSFKMISELIYTENYTIDHKGTQISN